MEHQLATKSTQQEQAKNLSSPSLPQLSPNQAMAHPLLRLQRAIGNQAVQNMMKSENLQIDPTTQTFIEPRFGKDFSRIPVYSSHPPVFQTKLNTKLNVNRPGDVYEQEADQVAEQIMRVSDQQTPSSNDQNESKNSLMRKQSNQTAADSPTEAPVVPPVVHSVLSSGEGHPLDKTTRALMEPRFGHDFSDVRVHTDAKAAQSARAVNALAYTVGRDVVFGAGQFSPYTREGNRLIAHELVHYLQQNGGQASTTSLVQRSPDDKGGTESEGGLDSPYEAEQEVIRYAVGAYELGSLAKGTVLYTAKYWKAAALSENAFYVGPFTSDMGSFYYVYRFTGSDQKTGIYMLTRGNFLPGSDTKDLQASLAEVQSGKALKLKIVGLVPPAGGAVAKTVKKEEEKGGAEKKTGAESASKSKGAEEPAVLTPQRRKWLTAGRANVKSQIILSLIGIKQLKDARLQTWEKNANIKDPKPLKTALEVAIDVVASGMGQAVGGLLTEELAKGVVKDFVEEASKTVTENIVKAIYEHAVEPAGEFMEEATKKVLKESTEGEANAALASKSSLLDCYVEAMRLQIIDEEQHQGDEFNATVDKKFPDDLALVDLKLVMDKLVATLRNQPGTFLRELSIGLIRLMDMVDLEKQAEKYGGDVSRVLKEDPEIHKVEVRSGNLLLVGPLAGIGKWSNPTFSFDGFKGFATEVNAATLAQLEKTAVKDLPLTLAFRFWVDNPFASDSIFDIFREVFSKVWFEHRPDGSITVDIEQSEENGLVWLASYYLGTTRDFTKSEREAYAGLGAKKLYEQIKNMPVIGLENNDLF
jgi:hypothetical protein